MESGRMRRLPRRQLGLEAPAKTQLAQQIASVVALSLQRNARGNGTGGLPSGKEGLLASTLRLAQQNAANMTAYLQRKSAETAVVTRELERDGEQERNVCVICLDGDMVSRDAVREEERVEALPCGHVFHAHCIAQWLLYRRVCPVDRQPLTR